MDKIEAVIKDFAGIISPNIEIGEKNCDHIKTSLISVVGRLKQVGLNPSIRACSEGGETTKTKIGLYVTDLVDCCILLLTHLSEKLTEENEEDSEFLKRTECLIQFVLKFGIVAYLEPNVCQKDASRYQELYDCFSPREKYSLLYKNAGSFVVICHNQVLRTIIIERWLTKIFAALMQLCFSPSSHRLLDINERKICMQNINLITEAWISKKRLIEEIILLQGNLTTHIAPKWLQSKCGLVLSRILLEKGGVKDSITTMVSNFEDSDAGSNWEQVVALSSIISTLPSKGTTPEKYCELVCPQLIQLLEAARKQPYISQAIARVSVTSLHALHEKYPTKSATFEKQICHALARCCRGWECVSTNNISNWQVSNCIENLHQICVSVGVVPESLLTLLIKPYLRLLFLIMCDLRQTSSHIVQLAKDLIQTTIKSDNQEEAARLVLGMYGESVPHSDPNKMKVPRNMSFILAEDGELKPILNNGQYEPAQILQQQDIKVNQLLDILSTLGWNSLIGSVFLLLLKCLCDPSKNIPQEVDDNNKLLTDMDRAALAMENNSVRLITFGLLTSMCESFESSILLSDVSQIISFIKMVLKNLITDQEPNEYKENLGICLSVLGICLMSDMSSKEKNELSSIVPIMQKLCDNKAMDARTKELISDLTIAISTYGAVCETSINMFSEVMKDQLKKFENLNLTSDVAGDTEKVAPEHKTLSTDGNSSDIGAQNEESRTDDKAAEVNLNDTQDDLLSFNEAMEAVYDTCPALKGGAIRYLTKCIKQKLHIAVEKLDDLTKIFIECLDCDDSFVYLSAVHGLAIIANTATCHLASKSLLDKLISKFMHDPINNEKKDSSNEIVSRMKLGEIIMRIIRELGDMGSHHAYVLLPEFLVGSRHANPDMRASCLSNFAELAPMGHNFLTRIQYEVTECLCKIAKTDTDDMVRRAAIHAIRELITKLNDKFLQVFPDTTKEFYRTMKFVYEQDSDNVMQLHAQLALEELNEIMRTSIFQQPKLTKKITVLPT